MATRAPAVTIPVASSSGATRQPGANEVAGDRVAQWRTQAGGDGKEGGDAGLEWRPADEDDDGDDPDCQSGRHSRRDPLAMNATAMAAVNSGVAALRREVKPAGNVTSRPR